MAFLGMIVKVFAIVSGIHLAFGVLGHLTGMSLVNEADFTSGYVIAGLHYTGRL